VLSGELGGVPSIPGALVHRWRLHGCFWSGCIYDC